MRLLLIFICSLTFAFAAASPQLSADTLAKLSKDEQSLVLKALSTPSSVRTAEEWTAIGTTISTTLVTSITETARGLSMTVNEFANTPIGKLTVFIIVWKLFAATVLTKLFGVILLFIGPLAVNAMFKRILNNERFSGDSAVMFYITNALVVIVALLIVFN